MRDDMPRPKQDFDDDDYQMPSRFGYVYRDTLEEFISGVVEGVGLATGLSIVFGVLHFTGVL